MYAIRRGSGHGCLRIADWRYEMLKRENVAAVVELYRNSAGPGAPVETVHKLMLLAQRVQRLTKRGKSKMSERQGRAFERAVYDAGILAREIGAKGASAHKADGHMTLVVIWPDGANTVL